jgi:PAS domain S-box-containing protein
LLTKGEGAIGPAALAMSGLLVCSLLAVYWVARAAARTPWHGGPRPDNLPAIGAIAAAGLTVLWLIYRRLRARLSAVLAVHAALSAAAAGEKEPALLFVDGELGPEASAWNRLVADTDIVRRQAVADRAKQILERRHDSAADGNSICDILPQGIIVLGTHGQISYANGAAASFLRLRRDELSGADFARKVGIESVTAAVAGMLQSPNRRRQVLDVERRADDGDSVLRFIIRPLRSEDAGAVLIVIEDITQQRCAESARHQFVAQTTHELRTPLTNIRMYTELAIDEGETDSARRANCLNVINAESRRLERIVSGMLSVAEIEAGSMTLARDDVRLEGLLDDLKADYQQSAAEKKINLVFERPVRLPVFKGDRDKILLALHNLIGNALKYTAESGRVEIALESNDKHVTFRVKDTGFGISEADAERIFERFYRAKDPRVIKLVGSGIGLALAREVVRLHGGDITVESRLNQGSTFTLTLPVN